MRVAAIFLLACARTLGAAAPGSDTPLVLTHVAVVDTSGGPTRPDMTVVIRGDRIVLVKPSAGLWAVEKNARVVDGRGASLLGNVERASGLGRQRRHRRARLGEQPR